MRIPPPVVAACSPSIVSLGILVTAGAGLASCATSTRWEDLRGPEGAAVEAHAAAVAFVHESYLSPGSTPEPTAWCLWVPGVSQVAVRDEESARPDAPIPSPRLMSRLTDLDPPVLLPERCIGGEGGAIRLVAGGAPAGSLRVGMAEWQGADEVTIPLRVYEAPNASLNLECRVVKALEGWQVAECLQPYR